MSQSISIAIKNSVLLLLIILCFHVLLKNAVADREPFIERNDGDEYSMPTSECRDDVPGPSDPSRELLAPVPPASIKLQERCDMPPELAQTAQCKLAEPQYQQPASKPALKAGEDEDLYQYVFGEPLTAAASCGTGGGDNEKRSQTPTDLKGQKDLQEHKDQKGQSCAAANKGQQHNNTERGFGDVSGNMVIGTYRNEKGLNGGEIYGGLMAFESFGDVYEEI